MMIVIHAVSDAFSPFARLVVDSLLARVPADEIAIVVEDQQSAGGLADRCVEVRSGSFDDSRFAGTAFVGADRVHIISGPAPSKADPHQPDGPAVIDPASRIMWAAGSGARHLVYSGMADAYPYMRGNASALEWSGGTFTILRHNMHTEALAPVVALAMERGELVCAFGTGLLAPVSQVDCADAAAVVLTEDGHEFQEYHLTGMPALRPLGIASLASRIAGRQITVREVDPIQLADELRRGGATDELANQLDDLYRIIQAGGTSTTNTAMVQLLGRDPLTVEEALREALAEVATNGA